MSIVSPKEISGIRAVERLAKTRFHKSDIPDGAEIVRKKLFFYLEQIETAQPEGDFAKIYQSTIHEKFEDMDKDELIRRLIWLQLKDTMEAYNEAEDLNAGYANKGENRQRGTRSSVRLFINIGMKDGITGAEKLLHFITDSTDIEPGQIDRITVRDLSSFFNVSGSAAEFIVETMSQKKFKGRKIRIEEAEQRDRDRGGFGGGRGFSGNSGEGKSRGGSRGGYPTNRSFSGGNEGGRGRGDRGGSQKFNRRNRD